MQPMTNGLSSSSLGYKKPSHLATVIRFLQTFFLPTTKTKPISTMAIDNEPKNLEEFKQLIASDKLVSVLLFLLLLRPPA
jgi:hypothetical protein